MNWRFGPAPHASLANRRIRGLACVDGELWIEAYAQNAAEYRLLQYDVRNAITSDITLAAARHDFGACVAGFSRIWDMSVQNAGNMPLVVDSAVFEDGSLYTVSAADGFPAVIPGSSEAVSTVTFSPADSGIYRDTLYLYSNDPDENITVVAVRGAGLRNEGDIEAPLALDFGEVWVNPPSRSTAQILEVQNRGAGRLTVTALELSGVAQFRLELPALPVVIDSQSQLDLRVWFEPRTAGNYSATFTLHSADPDEGLLTMAILDRAQAIPSMPWGCSRTSTITRRMNC